MTETRNPLVITDRVLSQVLAERIRQTDRWGPMAYPDGTGRPGDAEFAAAYKAICKANDRAADNWRDILAEEEAEAFAETDPARLRAELIQVAAVAVAWIEDIDRRLATQSTDSPGPTAPATGSSTSSGGRAACLGGTWQASAGSTPPPSPASTTAKPPTPTASYH